MSRGVNKKLATAAPIAMIAALGAPAFGGLLDDDVLIETSGDGIVYVDTTEGVVEPGMKAVTFTSTRVPGPNPPKWLYLDPFENIVTDYTTIGSRGETTNCIMASNENFCDSAPASGKRIKTHLYGPGPFDALLSTTPSTDYPLVDYFTFGKISNFTAARITGFTIELLDADGNPMSDRAAAEAVLFNLDPTLHESLAPTIHVVHGLFGNGGQEAATGFFSGDDASFDLTASSDVLDLGSILMTEDSDGDGSIDTVYADNFGTAMLNDANAPDGVFWDETPNVAGDEDALLTWYHVGNDTWYYGNLGTADTPANAAALDARLAAIAADLGVTVPDLGYTAGGDPVPAAIVDAMEGDELFSVGKIEDLRNANLNYTITVGNVEEGQFTVRIAPRFAPIVELTDTLYQFGVAGALDAANIPYLGADPTYIADIATLEGLPVADAQLYLERLGYSFLGAQRNIGYEMASQSIGNILFGSSLANGSAYGASFGTMSSKNGEIVDAGANWAMAGSLEGFVAVAGSMGSVADTPNSIGYDFNGYTATAGLSTMLLNDNVEAGVAFSFGKTDATINDNRGSLSQQSFGGAVFGRGAFDNGVKLNGVIGYQMGDIESIRNIDTPVFTGTATGTNPASDLFLAVSGEWMASMGSFQVGPMASLEYHHISTDGFTETGAGLYNVTMDGFTSDVFTGNLGLKGSVDLSDSFSIFGHAAYAMMSSDDLAVPFQFGSVLNGTTFVDGASANWFDIGAGAKAKIGEAGSLALEYRGALFSNDYSRHTVRASFEVTF
ncbi:choice-of-anchor F family protein [Sinisalibacter lacisalsi]|uniref:Autotransporter domain-containing protein n=1 Tax=Sinisalibacter lacisalsi TaxID=1526570 RepID=A0ABQ1QRE8_9RHOB|nr:choice-of-anchor F family protein [Sinisalibacter lacisalsi]GGD40989.1 hypothetical protein GCM10011358_26050 [Sinisalibacter lacisalsi]